MKINDGSIYVVTHKKFQLSEQLQHNGYKLISVGDANYKNLSGICDNTEENISEKNKNYCELTALYWIWKNDDVSQYKGLCHYRRFFTKSIFSQKEKYFLNSNDIKKYFNNQIDVILPEKQYFIRTATENYTRCGYRKDLAITRNVLKEKYPEYLDSFDKVMNGNWSYLTNMLIAKTTIFDEYCNWLFDILFEVEKKTDISNYTVQEARIYGYISERLLTVWVMKNCHKYNCKEIHTVNTEEKKNIQFYVTQIMIKLGIYQKMKTLIWKVKNYKKDMQ